MWRENTDGEWYWPLDPSRPADHLRVWRSFAARPVVGNMVSLRQDEWRGALVIDGEYLDPTRVGPFQTADEARAAAFQSASAYLSRLSGALAAGGPA